MNPVAGQKTMTLLELTAVIGRLVQVESTSSVWVTAEISDFSVRGGHCYMELVQKSADGKSTVARSRAVIWANNFYYINSEFLMSTGQPLATGMKVMILASVSYHPVFGLSLVISGINPEFTIGDMVRRRREMIERLTAEGVIDMNRSLEWPEVSNRIAVVSAENAAGYGDFMHQLYSNPSRLRFTTRLFPAIMQGTRSAQSIIEALECIAADCDSWDGVVVIRGGGATDDLACFDNYDLANNIAQFPLPVIIGIGHERDITLLDYVANMRVKTPTAAAEWLISHGNEALGRLQDLGNEIAHTASDIVAGYNNMIERSAAMLPTLAGRITDRIKNRLDTATQSLHREIPRIISVQNRDIDSIEKLISALSPEAVLKRGYTITCGPDRHAVTSVAEAEKLNELTTIFADGEIKSEILRGS